MLDQRLNLRGLIALVVIVVVGAGCFAHGRAPQTRLREARVGTFAGLYTGGSFEVSRFDPCDRPTGDGPWWVVLDAPAIRQRDSLVRLAATSSRTYFVVWTASISDTGAVGHLGQSNRAISVHRIDELREPRRGDCRVPAGWSMSGSLRR